MNLQDIKKYKEFHEKLWNKSEKIKDIYGLYAYTLESIGFDEYGDKEVFTIKCEWYISGCGTEYEYLDFNIEEMAEDLDYFKDKREAELVEQKRKEEEIQVKEEKDKQERRRLKYEELKKEFE